MYHEWAGKYNGSEWRILRLVAGAGFEITVNGRANYSTHYGSYGEALQAIIQYVNGR